VAVVAMVAGQPRWWWLILCSSTGGCLCLHRIRGWTLQYGRGGDVVGGVSAGVSSVIVWSGPCMREWVFGARASAGAFWVDSCPARGGKGDAAIRGIVASVVTSVIVVFVVASHCQVFDLY
jgi:hypothetical protein